MRFWSFSLLVLAVAGCTRPSAGLSFHDLVWAASDGLREYEQWVKEKKDGFPNELCLAGIHLSASLAETTGQSGSAGLQLAAPAFGLTGMLGYQFISSQSETGTISASLEASYQKAPEDAKKAEEKRDAFIADIPRRRALKSGSEKLIEEPPVLPDYAGRERPPFAQRDDLAAELWRIRQTIHGAVLNSPKDMVLKPGPMTLRIGYVATVSAGGGVSIKLGGQPIGDFGASGGSTEQNEMVLFFLRNTSKQDRFNCHEDSIAEGVFTTLVEMLDQKVSPVKAPDPPKS